MKVIKKMLFIATIAISGFSMVSCENENIDTSLMKSSELEASSNELKATQSDRLLQRSSKNFDEIYSVDLSNYIHVYQRKVMGMCGPCTYVSARSILNPAYPTAYSNASIIKSELDNQYGLDNWGIYQLYSRNDQTLKKFKSWKAGNNLWGLGREKLKQWIKDEISSGRPCVIPCLYGMSTDTSKVGHFYLIVSLFLTKEGTGSVVGVKDVWKNDSSTYYFSYTALLSSNWYNAQKAAGKKGRESYSVMCFK